jgi:hypothetical protein
MKSDPAASSPRVCLVLSTGRCGSTVMSDIVSGHPMALSVSELSSGLRDSDLSERELTGVEFWNLLSTPCLTDVVGLRCKVRVDEMLYPAFSPRPGASRFTWATGLPPLMQACIPHLTDRPDDLYARIESAAAEQPARMLSVHMQWLFGMLAGDRRPAVVVERSGGSLSHVKTLTQLFPRAKVVHLFRDGRECAVSMSRHGRYKMAMIRAVISARLGYDPYGYAGVPGDGDAKSGQAIDEDVGGLLPERMTRTRFDQFDVPLARYGAMWSKMIAEGVAGLPDQSRVLAIDYADLTARPAETICRFFEFIGLDCDQELAKRLAAGVRPGRNVREEAGEQSWNELTRACRLGLNRLYGRGNWA